MDNINLKKFKPRKPVKNKKYKVCFYSNSPAMATGYAKVLREVCSRLAKDPNFDVHVIAENYIGEPKPFMGFTLWGMSPDRHPSKQLNNQANYYDAFYNTYKKIEPDVVIVLEDTFTLSHQGWRDWSLKHGRPCPLIMYLPLDGDNVPTNGIPILRMVDKIVSMSKFTAQAARKDGFESDVIYHGVDLLMFKPVTNDQKNALRKKYGFDEDCFLLFNYGRNNLRKANQRLCEGLAKYLKDKDPKKHKAFLHIMKADVEANNIYDYWNRNIVQQFGINFLETGHVIMNPKAKDFNNTVTDNEIADYLKMADIVVSASSGEGFGLLMPEAMACGKPVIQTEYTTPHELLIEKVDGIGPRGILIPLDATITSSFNTTHGFINTDKMVEAIAQLEKDPELRKQMGKNGRMFVEKTCNWDYLVEQWKKTITDLL